MHKARDGEAKYPRASSTQSRRSIERGFMRNPLLSVPAMRYATVLLFTTPCGVLATEAAQGKTRPPNIVFIIADDLGINDLACYGRKDHHTPNLDKLAKQGMRFTDAYSAQSVCSPTRAAIM